MANASKNNMWLAAYENLDRDVMSIIVKKVRETRSAMHPVNQVAVQDAKARMKSWEPTQMSTTFEIPYNGKTYTAHISQPQNHISVVLRDVAAFQWKRMAGVDVGVFVDESATEDEERLFYGILAVVLTSRASAPISVDDIMVHMDRPVAHKSITNALLNIRERVNQPPVPLRERIHHLFYSRLSEGGSVAKTKPKTKYNGRMYTVHTGSRGGKYINVLSKKVYVTC